MRRKFEELRENLDEFVTQCDYPMLIVGCLSEELAYVVKFLQALDGTHPESLFATFPHPFVTAHDYLDGVVESLIVQVEAARQLRADRGASPLPPVPPELAAHEGQPSERLRAILDYLRGLLPNEQEHAVVVGLLPLECRSLDEYAALVGSLAPHGDVPPWMAPLRIVAYDDRSKRAIRDALSHDEAQNVLTYEVDFSTPALTDSLSRAAADTSLPVQERMTSLLQLAALDYSYQRYPDALQKYGVVHDHYQQQNVPSMQALALLGAGDTLHAAGQPAAAKDMLQRGIGLSMQHKALAPLLNLLLSITDVCSEMGQYAEAEQYAESGAQVAAAVLNPFAYADLHEKKGDAQIAQGKARDGIATYAKCKELCRTYDYFFRWKAVLHKEMRIYEEAQMRGELRERRAELARVEELERTGRSESPVGAASSGAGSAPPASSTGSAVPEAAGVRASKTSSEVPGASASTTASEAPAVSASTVVDDGADAGRGDV